MLVMLYTSRIVLNSLGIENYGIYNVVGGVVSLFSCLKNSMITATQRYMTFEIGRGDSMRLNSVFSSSLLIHLGIGVMVLLLCESIGVWFLNHKMVIPQDRLFAANIVFHLSVLDLFLNLLNVPYNAIIIAFEKMSAFAYISIVNVILKLLIAFMLFLSPIDILVWYAILMLIVSILNNWIYWLYCKKNIKNISFNRSNINKALGRELFLFASFSFIGDLAVICYTQGLNVLLNVFFGPIINAARGIAVQVQGAIGSFSGNFQMAINPQITKSYAKGDLTYMRTLVFASSRYSCFLLLVISLPILIDTDYILKLWLDIVPRHSVMFVRLMLLITLIFALSNPPAITVHATGKIKSYQLVIGGINLLILPISYLVLAYGGAPESVFVINLLVLILGLYVRLLYLMPIFKMRLSYYCMEVLMPILIVSLVSAFIPLILFFNLSESWVRLGMIILSSVLSVCVSVYVYGMTSVERAVFNSWIKKLYVYAIR